MKLQTFQELSKEYLLLFLFCYVLFFVLCFSHRCFLHFSITGRHIMSLINKQRAIRRLVLHNVKHCQVMMKARTFNDIIVSDGNQLLDDDVSDDLKYVLQYHMGLYSIQNQGDFVMDKTEYWEYRISNMTYVDNRIWFMMCFHTIRPEDEEERVEVVDMTNDEVVEVVDMTNDEVEIVEVVNDRYDYDDVYFSEGEETLGDEDTDDEYCKGCRDGNCDEHYTDDDDE